MRVLQRVTLLGLFSRKGPGSGSRWASNRVLKQAKPELRKGRTALHVFGFITFGVFIASASYTYVLATTDPSATLKGHNVPDDVSDRYNTTAKDFDREVGCQESLMGLNRIRKRLVRHAHGNVLEVSAGTARNAKYFDEKKCETITLLDQSSEMIEIAKQKFKKIHPYYKKSRFVTQSALDPILAPPGGYDTIIQTMGICSTPDPVRLLRHLGQVLKPVKGRILLLEHGRGHYDWINRVLDNGAPSHANAHGCWWNKDIGKIIEQSGLEIVEMKRHHLGTTWMFILKSKDRPLNGVSETGIS